MATNNSCNYVPTNHAVQVGGTNGSLTSLSVGATNSLLQGSTGADPSFTTTPTVTSLTFGSGTALNTYVQGTFTPTIAINGSTAGITYSTQAGEYTQVGNIVYFTWDIQLSSKGASVGNVTIGGFPVAIGGTATNWTSTYVNGTFTYTAGYSSLLYQLTSATASSVFQLGNTVAGPTALTNTQISNNTLLSFSGFYFTS